MGVLTNLTGLNGRPFIHPGDALVDIGAFPVPGQADSQPGGRIFGRSFTEKDAERELKRIFDEDLITSESAAQLAAEVVAERKLTFAQRAERDLERAEAECERCADAALANPIRENYDRFSDADARLTKLKELMNGR